MFWHEIYCIKLLYDDPHNPLLRKAMEPSSQDHIHVISVSLQFTQLTPSPPPPPNIIMLPVVVIIAAVITLTLLLIITLLRKRLNLFCNNRTLNNQSTPFTTPSSNQNLDKLKPLSILSFITYDATPSSSDPASGSSPEMLVNTSCCICLYDYENGDELAILRKCKHCFHRVCISQWLPKRSVLCPVCRAPVMDLKTSSSSSSTLSQGNYSSSSAFVLGLGMRTYQPQLVY